jgi:hypothetical protein
VVVGGVLRHVSGGGGVTFFVRLLTGVVVLAGQAGFVMPQATDQEPAPDRRGSFTVAPKFGPAGTAITIAVRCTLGANGAGTPADSVVLHLFKAYDTSYDRQIVRPLDHTGSGVFTIVVPDAAPPTGIVDGGKDVAYNVGGSCFLDDVGLASFSEPFIVTAASVAPTVASSVGIPSSIILTNGQSQSASALPRTGTHLALPLTAATLLLIGVGLALRRAHRQPTSIRKR